MRWSEDPTEGRFSSWGSYLGELSPWLPSRVSLACLALPVFSVRGASLYLGSLMNHLCWTEAPARQGLQGKKSEWERIRCHWFCNPKVHTHTHTHSPSLSKDTQGRKHVCELWTCEQTGTTFCSFNIPECSIVLAQSTSRGLLLLESAGRWVGVRAGGSIPVQEAPSLCWRSTQTGCLIPARHQGSCKAIDESKKNVKWQKVGCFYVNEPKPCWITV